MILILSQDSGEITTEMVIDWIDRLGGDWIRLNGEDLNGAEAFSMRFSKRECALRFTLGAREFTAADVGVIWFRRWHRMENLAMKELLADKALAAKVKTHLGKELGATFSGMCALLGQCQWLTKPSEAFVNKLRALEAAARVGLDIPDTIVTNSKERLQKFKDAHPRIICKPIGNASSFCSGEETYLMYTSEATQQDIDRLPQHFFPSLAQELLEKAFELRVFYLEGECYAMAIFSQLDSQTQLDFRHYNYRRPNRFVPYRLPGEVEDGIRALMAALGLSTGSLDIVRTPEKRYVFLEVNPAGQFGMVSEPCNYNLERRVAEHLIRRDEDAHS